MNIMEFCKAFNARTQDGWSASLIPVVITVFSDRSFTFMTKTPPATLLMKGAGMEKGSGTPNKTRSARSPASRSKRSRS